MDMLRKNEIDYKEEYVFQFFENAGLWMQVFEYAGIYKYDGAFPTTNIPVRCTGGQS